MEGISKKKSPYHGVLLCSIILVLIPIVLSIVFEKILSKFQNFSADFTNLSAVIFGFGLGFVIQMSCVIAGIMNDPFKAVARRVVNFFDNLSISLKLAIKYYFYDVKEYGIVFWIYFILICSTLGITIYSIVNLFTNFSTYF